MSHLGHQVDLETIYARLNGSLLAPKLKIDEALMMHFEISITNHKLLYLFEKISETK